MVAPRARDVASGGDLVVGQAGHLVLEGREVVDKGLRLVVVGVLPPPAHLAEQRVAVLVRGRGKGKGEGVRVKGKG